MTREHPVRLGGFPLDMIIRKARRAADFSQRELAKWAGTSPSTIAGIESGARVPSLRTLQRILHAANYRLVVVDASGRLVAPLQVWGQVTDLAGRRLPPHLDTILDPAFGEWWADGFGLARPPETFRRNRAVRDYERRLSRWEVRVKQYRRAPRQRLMPGSYDLPEDPGWPTGPTAFGVFGDDDEDGGDEGGGDVRDGRCDQPG